MRNVKGGWAVEGASPYNSEITASPEHGRTLFAPTDVCGIIKGCEINNNAKCQRGVGCRGRQPLQIVRGSLLCRKIAVALCGGALCRRLVKRCRFLCFDFVFVIGESLAFFFFCLHRLIGLRRMRLCLILRKGLCPLTLQAL